MARWLRLALPMTRLKAALDRVVDNRGAPGVDGVTVFDFAAQGQAALAELQGDVVCGRYTAQPLRRAWLPRLDGKPPRPLGIPTVRDRVIQTAVAQTLAPLLEAEFEECSYAYRQGRSVRMAVERIASLQRQGYTWVVEADIERFFDTIPHAPLLARLDVLVDGDAELVALVRQWLTAPVRDEQAGTLTPVTGRGIPQGSPLSPALANLYLDHLDEALIDADHALVRYADDFVVLARSRERAEAAVELTGEVLDDLALRLNPLKTRVVSFEQGFEFLGWNFVRSLAVQSPPHRHARESGNPPFETPSPPPVGARIRGHDEGVVDTRAAEKPPPAPLPRRRIDPNAGALAQAFAEALAEQPAWAPDPVSAPRAPAPVPAPGPAQAAVPVPASAQPFDIEDFIAQADASDAPPERSDAADPLHPDAEDPASGGSADDTASTHDKADTPADSTPPPSLQRTLYLVDPAASLSTENRHLIVKREGAVLLDLPAVNVDQVVLLGRNAVTTPALVCCAQHGIAVALLSRTGRFYGRLEPPGGDAVRLQQAQFGAQQVPGFNLGLARQFVHGKLANAALVLSRYARSRREVAGAAKVQEAIQFHRRTAQQLKTLADLETLRGHEGAAAAAYFAAWRTWLTPTWTFGAREAQTRTDPVNALLDFGYTLLRHAVAGLIQARGLTPWLGHLHAVQSGHMALASDLMEEFRPIVVDTVVLNLCLNQRLRPDDFTINGGACTLKPTPAKLFIREIENRLNTEIRTTVDGELQDLRRLIDAQVRLLAQAYRMADATVYRPCVMK